MSLVRRFLWPQTLLGKAGMVALYFLVVLGVAYFAADYFTSKRLKEAMKLSEAFGLSHSLDELLGPSVAPEHNAAIFLDEAGNLAERFHFFTRQKLALGATAEVVDNPKLLAEYESLLKDPVYNRFLEDADRCEGYRSTDFFNRPILMANPRSDVFKYRTAVSRVENELVILLLRAGRTEEAARRMLRLLRLTRKWEDKEPFLVATLANMSVRGFSFYSLNAVLRNGKPLPPALHAEIDEELGRQEQIKRILPWVIQTGSELGCDFYELGPWGRLPFGDLLAKEGKKTTLQTAHRLQLTADKPYVDAYNEIQTMISEIKEARGNPLGGIITLGADGLLASELMGRRAFERTVARVRCLRVLNALANRGNFNAEITSLGIPRESLVDPFDGKTLRIKKTPNGPIIYSVGDDLKDDNGNVGPPVLTDIGYGPVSPHPEKK